MQNFDNLIEWSYKMQGAREMLEAVIESVRQSKGKFLLDNAGKDSKVYHEAIVKLVLSNVSNTAKFLDKIPIAYRNHKHDQKGKLIYVEAYYVR